jgi:hypothetical protein
MFASKEDASVMKIDDGGELGGRERSATRSNDGDENLWHEKLHERRVHHQSGKKRKRDPSPVTRASMAAMAEIEVAALVAELGGVEVCTCESNRDGQELLHSLIKASEEEGEAKGDVAAGDLAIDGRRVVRV